MIKITVTTLLLLTFVICHAATDAPNDNSCIVTVHEFNFGEYTPTATAPTYSQNTIEITCPPSIVPTIKFDAGFNAGIGNFHNRKLRSSHSELDYNLYVDATCTKVWGDGTNNTYVNSGSNQIIVYGKIPPKQKVSAGYYSDRLTVTVEW